jgi:hypothetical protein
VIAVSTAAANDFLILVLATIVIIAVDSRESRSVDRGERSCE